MAATNQQDTGVVIGKVKLFRTKLLGKGRFGTVFEGQYNESTADGSWQETRVAVKRINRENVNNENNLLEFQLCHDNVVRCLASEENDDFFFFVMELCCGTLDDLVHKTFEGPSPGTMNEVLHQITLGLEYLHRNKIVHRDLKPQNILISSSDEQKPKMKLADFGMSERCAVGKPNIKRITGTVGTVGWCAPELLYSNDGGKNNFSYYAVDVFSLGCVFGYALSGGHHPYGEVDMRNVNIKQGAPDWEHGEKNINDEQVKKLIKTMIDRQPKNRPSVEQVLNNSSLFPPSSVAPLLRSSDASSSYPSQPSSNLFPSPSDPLPNTVLPMPLLVQQSASIMPTVPYPPQQFSMLHMTYLQPLAVIAQPAAVSPTTIASRNTKFIPRNGDLIEEFKNGAIRLYKGTVRGGQVRAVKRIKKTCPQDYSIRDLENYLISSNKETSSCPYIVQYFNYEEDSDFYYLEMELCLGSLNRILHQSVSSNEPSTRADANKLKQKTFLKQILEGLVHLHKMNLVHGDVTPLNVLIYQSAERKAFTPKIANCEMINVPDAPFSYGFSSLTTSSSGITDDGWRAPELQPDSNQCPSQAADVFTVGCLLFFIVTDGRHPFVENDEDFFFTNDCKGETVQKNIDSYKPNVKLMINVCEATCLDLICRAIERKPHNRPSSTDMLDHVLFKLSHSDALDFLAKAEKHFKTLPPEECRPLERVLFGTGCDWVSIIEQDEVDQLLQEARKCIPYFKNGFSAEMRKSIHALLLLITSLWDKYDNMNSNVKRFFGKTKSKSKYFEYWHDYFPELLIRTWNAVNQRPTHELQVRLDLESLIESTDSDDA